MTLEHFVIGNEVRNADEQAHEMRMTATEPSARDCGCAHDRPCTCGPRLRIFDPMGRLLMSPVYY